MNKQFLIWFAGFLDGDGCFSIVLKKQRTARDYLAIASQVRIGQRCTKKAEQLMKMIMKETGVGHVYYSNKDKPNAVVYWQTTRLRDSLAVAKAVFPYLRFKEDRVKLFIEALELWQNTYNYEKARSRQEGSKIRVANDVLKVVKIATSINANRQTKRYRDYKGYDYWKPLIKKWYGQS